MSAVLVEDGPDKGAIWHFGEPVKEQRAIEAGTAWADLSHLSVIAVSGEDRLKWLHDLTTQFLTDLEAGMWKPAMILDPQGHVEYQFNLVDDGTTTFLILDASYAESLVAYLTKMRFMLKVDVRDATSEFAVLRAPGATTDIGGPFALVPRGEVAQMAQAFNAVATQVGTWALEGNPPRRLTMLHLDGSDVGFPATGTKIENDGVVVGFIGTVARHHELGTIALAIVKRNTPLDATLSVDGIAAAQQPIV